MDLDLCMVIGSGSFIGGNGLCFCIVRCSRWRLCIGWCALGYWSGNWHHPHGRKIGKVSCVLRTSCCGSCLLTMRLFLFQLMLPTTSMIGYHLLRRENHRWCQAWI